MPKFIVWVTEEVTYGVPVEADDAEQAQEEAEEKFLASTDPFKDFTGEVTERDFTVEAEDE